MNEVWQPVVGYEGLYEVSDQGRVRSLKSGLFLKPFFNRGYFKVNLHKDSVQKLWQVHQLVAYSFLGDPPAGLIVLHGPAGCRCNSLTNLSYGTHKQNSQDRLRDGTLPFGTDVHTCKLSEEQVLDIFHAKLSRSFSRKALAAKHNISEACVKAIRSGRNWGWLTSPHADLAAPSSPAA